MSIDNLYLIFFGGLIPLMFIGYVLARGKAFRLVQQGIKIHSQPDQYGWFAALYTGLPAISIAVCGVFLYLFGINSIPPLMLIAAALSVAAFALLFILFRFNSKTKARDLVEGFIRGLLILASFISILTTFGILISILFEAMHFFCQRERLVFSLWDGVVA